MNGSKYGLDNSVYLSYARRADKTLINRLIDVAASDEIYQSGIDDAGEVKERQPVDVAIRIDEEHLSFGESIKEFMDEIATSRRALFVISDEYFRSPYCMYECVSAYNAINPLKPKADVKPFYPAAVFVEDGKTKDDAILVFKKDGCPSLCVEKFIDHWKKELQGCSDASHAPYWYQKYIDMIEELECWLIGRRFLIDPDSLLPVFSVESQCDDSQIIKYIRRARNPIENEYALPSRDKLLASTTTDFCNVLAGLPENSKMFNRGNEFGSGDEILSYVTGVLRGDVAEFVKKDLGNCSHPYGVDLASQSKLDGN